MLNNNRNLKTLSDKYKIVNGHLPHITEDGVSARSPARTVYGKYNMTKTFYKPGADKHDKHDKHQQPTQQQSATHRNNNYVPA